MALPLANNAEGGSDETTVTTGNSGGASGNAWDNVNLGTGPGSIVFDSALASEGSFSYRFDQPGTHTVFGVYWSDNGGSIGAGLVTEVWGRFYHYRTTHTTDSDQVLRINDGAGTRLAIILPGITADQKLYVGTPIGGGQTGGVVNIAVNQWVRYEFHFIKDNTVGMIEAKLFNSANSTIADDTVTRANFDTDTGVAGIRTQFGFGVANTLGLNTMWLDGIQVNGTGYPGPAVAEKQSFYMRRMRSVGR